MRQYNNSPSVNAPREYFLIGQSSLSLTESTIMDIPLPAKRVDVHVQDPAGYPVPDVDITTNDVLNYSLAIGTLPARGYSYYPYYRPPAMTDASGNATLWLFPSPPGGATYVLTADPPSGSGFATTSLPDVAVTEDTSLTITLVVPVTLSGRVLDPWGSGIPD